MQEKISVLVIDDMQALRLFLCTSLASDGYNVRGCEDGASALQAASEGDYQFFIVDYRMPRMNGVELTKLLRVRFPKAVIIGASTDDLSKAFLPAGADYFMLKPFNYEDLRDIIKSKQ